MKAQNYINLTWLNNSEKESWAVPKRREPKQGVCFGEEEKSMSGKKVFYKNTAGWQKWAPDRQINFSRTQRNTRKNQEKYIRGKRCPEKEQRRNDQRRLNTAGGGWGSWSAKLFSSHHQVEIRRGSFTREKKKCKKAKVSVNEENSSTSLHKATDKKTIFVFYIRQYICKAK